MENIIAVEIMDINALKEITRIYKNQIDKETDPEKIEDLKDEWFGEYWDLFYNTINTLDIKTAYASSSSITFSMDSDSNSENRYRIGDVVKDFLGQLDEPPFRKHEMEKITKKVMDELFQEHQDDIDSGEFAFAPPAIAFYVDKTGKRGYELRKTNLKDLYNDIPGLEDAINNLKELFSKEEDDDDDNKNE